MKKTIILLIGLTFSLITFGQKPSALTEYTTQPDSTWQLYIWNGTAGQNIGRIKIENYFGGANLQEFRILDGILVSTAELNKIVGLRTDSTLQEQIDVKLDKTNSEAGSLFYALHAPDTVQHTENYTVAASDYRKDQHCNKATSIVITLPTNLTEWPIGGIMNFYGEGAGIMVFKGGTIISDSDSIATSRRGQTVSVKKLAASKYFLIGPLTD